MRDTADPALAKAEADLKRVDEEIERATKERDEIIAFIRRHKMYATTTTQTHRAWGAKPQKDETLVEAIEAILNASPLPMLVPDIVSALNARGRKINSVDPARLISSMMSRSDHFSFEKGRGWSIA